MRRRLSARLLVLDRAGRVLLFRFVYEGAGSALDEGETFEEAALRELREETGIRVKNVGPPVRSREFVLQLHDGEYVIADERYSLIEAQQESLSGEGRAPLEKEVMAEHRWRSVEDLARTSEMVWPENIPEILRETGWR